MSKREIDADISAIFEKDLLKSLAAKLIFKVNAKNEA